MTRKYTRKILEMIEEGLLTPEIVLKDALNWMSEDDVADMGESNGYFEFEDEDEEEPEYPQEDIDAEEEYEAGKYTREADRIDGYDRDDLGESPDY